MQDTQAFAPFYKVTVPTSQTGTLFPSVTVAATATSAVSGTVPGAPNGAGVQLQIANTSTTSFAYVNFGIAGAVVDATVAASLPVPPLTAKPYTVDPEVNGVSVIMGAGSANVIFTRGQGVG